MALNLAPIFFIKMETTLRWDKLATFWFPYFILWAKLPTYNFLHCLSYITNTSAQNDAEWRKTMKRIVILFVFILVCSLSSTVFAKEKEEKEDEYQVPDHVLSIAKENTFPNQTKDTEEIEASDSTKELLETTDVDISNQEVIKMLNETSIKPSPIGIGYRGMIFLGRWPLNYDSEQTSINWEYQEINENELNNFGGDTEQKMSYYQEERKEILGALTNEISHPEDIRTMMLQTAKEKTNLPLTYQTVIGEQTSLKNTYHVAAEEMGILHAHAPAVHEKGKITFGEVYIKLKGNKKSIVVKNVVKQGIGAWIPIQDHVSLSFTLE